MKGTDGYINEIKNDKSNSLEQLSTFFNSDDFYKIVNEFKTTNSNIKSKLTTLTNYIIKYSLRKRRRRSFCDTYKIKNISNFNK